MSWLNIATRALQFSSDSLAGADDEVASRVRRRLAAVRLRFEGAQSAMEAYRKALRVQRRLLHPAHPELVSTQLGLARSLHGLGDAAGALRDIELAEDTLRKE